MVSSGGYVASFSVETWGFHTTEREEETSPTNRADLITIIKEKHAGNLSRIIEISHILIIRRSPSHTGYLTEPSRIKLNVSWN